LGYKNRRNCLFHYDKIGSMNKTGQECKISVIIATRNRAKALEKISLPSLEKQTFKDFEVIIWDASDNNDSAEVVKKFPELNLRYFKAPRVGSCSQRNDAVKVSEGDIVFFMDDDSELSPDALEGIHEAMTTTEIAGCSPQGVEKASEEEKIKDIFLRIFSKIFLLGGEGKKMIVLNSGRHVCPKRVPPGEAQWLGGCAAYRKEIFQNYSFDEELQRFSGYALGEDLLFSHSLFRAGQKLVILNIGKVIHHRIQGERGDPVILSASKIFNFFLIWKKTIFPTNKISVGALIVSIIGSIILGVLVLLFRGNPGPIKGTFLGLKEILKYLCSYRHY